MFAVVKAMVPLLQALVLFILVISPVNASWQFLSRPDLDVPTLNITHPAVEGKTAAGYLFVAPFAGGSDQEKHGPLQPGPYIFDDRGNLIWSGFAQYFSIWTVNLQKTTFRGKDALLAFQGKHNAKHGHGHGHLKVLDSSYRLLTEIGAGHHRLMDKHEGQVIEDGKSALFQVYHPVPRRLAEVGGDSQHEWIVDSQFQEVDVATGQVNFEWNSLDHVPPSHSNISLVDGLAGDGSESAEAWDYFHINSVDKNDQGDYLISARDTNSIYKISGKSGDIIWRLGGRNIHSDFKHADKDVAFSYQHHARFQGVDEQGREIVSLYDNSAYGTETSDGRQIIDAPTSSGKILALDHGKKIVSTLHAYYPPFGLRSKSQGSTHVLPDGNVVVNWGSEGAVTDYSKNGTIVFHAFLDSGSLGMGVQNYRAFKDEWKGTPSEEPAIVGLRYAGKEWSNVTGEALLSSPDAMYVMLGAVSWNGDTEVTVWRFEGKYDSDMDVSPKSRGSAQSKQDQRGVHIMGQTDRTGFETRVRAVWPAERALQATHVRAIGINKDGKEIIKTRWESIEDSRPVPPSHRLALKSGFVVSKSEAGIECSQTDGNTNHLTQAVSATKERTRGADHVELMRSTFDQKMNSQRPFLRIQAHD